MRFLSPADLERVDRIVDAGELTVAMGEGSVTGLAAAALLFADFAVLRDGATLRLDTPEGWAGAVWRLGRGALRLLTDETMDAVAARDAGLCDEVTSLEPEAWLEEWTRRRSVVALDAAAALIRSRGGDRLERAEFARLFAIGEPQKGLGAFLAKRPVSF
jgi:enoyl-CoA hydratase/carnithine racemase